MDISLLPGRAAKDHEAFLEKLSFMSQLIDNTLAQVRTIVTELRPVVLNKLGLIPAIEWHAQEFQERSGIACEIHLPAEEISLESDRATAVFRIFQEALTNIGRHANASKVVVDLKREAESLVLAVRDNGKGIDEAAIHAPNSLGLLGIRERALFFGGTTEVTGLLGGGTLVSVRIPIK
jgi:signal transduction histidine kinase